jgi:hypothetical protein
MTLLNFGIDGMNHNDKREKKRRIKKVIGTKLLLCHRHGPA